MQLHSPRIVAALPGGDAERSVEFLCTKYEALNGQLQKEETNRRDAEARTLRLELQVGRIAEVSAAQTAALTAELSSANETVNGLRGRVEDSGFRASKEQRQAREEEASALKIEQRCQELERRCRDEAAKCAEASEHGARVEHEAAQWQHTCNDLERRLRQVMTEQSIVKEDLCVVEQRALLLRDETAALENKLRDSVLARESSDQAGHAHRRGTSESRAELERQEAQLEGFMTALEVAQDEKLKLELRLTAMQEEERRGNEELALIAQQSMDAQRDYTTADRELQRSLQESATLFQQLQQEEKAREWDSMEVNSLRTALVNTEAALEEAIRTAASNERTLRDVKQQQDLLESEVSREASRLEDLRQTHVTDGVAFEDLKVELQAVFKQREVLSEEREVSARERNALAVELRELGPALLDADRRCQLIEEDLARKSRELEDALGHRRRCQREIALANERARAFQSRDANWAQKATWFETGPAALEGTSGSATYGGILGSNNLDGIWPASPSLHARHKTVGFTSPLDGASAKSMHGASPGGGSLASATATGVYGTLGKHGLQYLKDFIEREEHRLNAAVSGSRSPSASASPART